MSIAKKSRLFLSAVTPSLLAILGMGIGTGLCYAQSAGVTAGDVTLSGIVLLEDHLLDLQKKLGSPACIITETELSRTVYIYRAGDRSFFSFVLNTARAHIDYDRINAMGMSNLLKLPPACQKSIPASSALLPIQAASQDGLRLGASIDQITGTYGQPEEIKKEGSHLRMTYSRDQGLNHHLVWTFNFDNGHLTDWTVEAFPVFYELGG
jgi:hypothetical protein